MHRISASMSDYAEAWLYLDGKPFDFSFYPMYRDIYDGKHQRLLLKTSRQVAKSTTLCNLMILECILIPHFHAIYISPSTKATRYFSASRVGKTIKFSPAISRKYSLPALVNRVEHKQLSNGSEMLFLFGKETSEDADRLRGPSSDRNMFDEVQDILYDPIIVVGNEMLSNSKYRYETYAGTPKSMENTIQYLWEQSSQTEWVMRCEGCGTRQFIDGEQFVGKHGPICLKCGHLLNPFLGEWVDMNPTDTYLKGFHVNRLCMPADVPYAVRHLGADARRRADLAWQSILHKYETLPISTFRNEVLGVSDARGSRLLSLQELESLCDSYHIQQLPTPEHTKDISSTFAGIDWSGGGTSGVSRTVLWIWGLNPKEQKLKLLFYRLYAGEHPVHVIDNIAEICRSYNVTLAVGDAGEGHQANADLRNRLGMHRLVPIQYGSQTQALKFNGQDRYTGDRTTLIDNYMMLLKNRGVTLACLEDMRPAINDIMNVYEETTTPETGGTGKKVWRHSPQKPDDCLHAGLFAWLAWKIAFNDLKFYQ